MIVGIDYYGAGGSKRYRDITIPRFHPEGWAAGFLVRATGWKSGLVASKPLAETGACPEMRFSGIWHDRHNFSLRDIPQAVRIAKRIAQYKETELYADVKIFYQPWLEPYCYPGVMRKCLSECRRVLPKEIKCVAGRYLPNSINEFHHTFYSGKGRFLWSYDGEDMLKSSRGEVQFTKDFHKRAKQFYCWCPECNGKSHLNENTKRQDRKHYLKPRHIRAMEALAA